MSTEPLRLAGPTMGSHWSVLLQGPRPADPTALQHALQGAVQQVSSQMSTWDAASDLMRFNAAPLNVWLPLPPPLVQVLAEGLAISQATGGAFEMNIADAVRAWGFCADPIDLNAIRAASTAPRIRAVHALQLDVPGARALKTAPLALDLSGIAKGYGVDRLAEVLADFAVRHALCTIDGEVRALGTQANGTPWPVAIEQPDSPDRPAHSVLALADGAVATSGDYRHFVTVKGRRLSHTMDPRRGAPRPDAPASVSVLAQSCAQADAMATALMVMGGAEGLAFAQQNHLSALFLLRKEDGFKTIGTGLFLA